MRDEMPGGTPEATQPGSLAAHCSGRWAAQAACGPRKDHGNIPLRVHSIRGEQSQVLVRAAPTNKQSMRPRYQQAPRQATGT